LTKTARVRLYQAGDLPAIQRIYGQAIAAGFCTADLEPPHQSRWDEWGNTHRDPRYPVFIWDENKEVLGYCSLTPYRPGRRGLARTAEISYYVDFSHHGRGIGQALVAHALHEAALLDFHVLFAIVLAANQPSLDLLSEFGFQQWGFLPDVFRYAGAWHGHAYYGKILTTPPESSI
jgi:L-amino acid N-acyltransferase YncA